MANKKYINDCKSCILEFICYDDGCHLRKYAQHECRRNVTPTAQLISKIEIVVDKMHFTGHKDKWCRDNCNPNTFEALNKVSMNIL